MQILARIILLTTGILLSFKAFAETVVLPRAANVRSSKTFYGRENVLDQLPQNAQVEIISRRALESGADALEIKIISPENKLSLNEKKPIYIWQSKAEIKNDLFKTEAGAVCNNCTIEPVKAPVAKNDIKDIVNKIEEQQSSDTEDCPSVEKVQKYSNSEQVAKSIQWAKDHQHKKSDGMCYRHTKEILATQTYKGRGPGNNMIPKWYPTPKPASAYKGANELLKYGFKNLLKCPEYKDQIMTDTQVNMDKIPSGAVLIYSRPGDDGHAEFKFTDPADGKTKYSYGPVLDFPVNRGTLGSKYKLIGVMVKP